MPYSVIEQITAALNNRTKSLKSAKVLVLGLAYKRDIDDLRESPALVIIELLPDKGALVAYNDPYFPTVGHGRHYDLNMTCVPMENLGQI
jgi:UDP-N-acetyl-D-glucosamine dehydrogenase